MTNFGRENKYTDVGHEIQICHENHEVKTDSSQMSNLQTSFHTNWSGKGRMNLNEEEKAPRIHKMNN
jgi:hypothetical protein